MPDTPQIPSYIQICIKPFADEDDDMLTLALVEDMYFDLITELKQSSTYEVKTVSSHTRGWGVIQIFFKIIKGMQAHKDFIAQFFQVSKTGIEMLGKRGHVKKIEMSIDGNKFSIEEPSTLQADRLISIYEARFPAKLQQITPASKIEITALVAKDANNPE